MKGYKILELLKPSVKKEFVFELWKYDTEMCFKGKHFKKVMYETKYNKIEFLIKDAFLWSNTKKPADYWKKITNSLKSLDNI